MYRSSATYTRDVGSVKARADGRERSRADRPISRAEVRRDTTAGHLHEAGDHEVAGACCCVVSIGVMSVSM